MRRVRATVDLDHDRPRSWRFAPLDQPGVEHMALRVADTVADRITAEWLQPQRAMARKLAHPAVFDSVDLGRPPTIGGNHRQMIARNRQGIGHDLAREQGGCRTGCDIEAILNGSALVSDLGNDCLIVEPFARDT
jgi:hypothetical protein